ncbi:MAG TPA: hypothetical protein VHO46_00920 [Bacteroidales bacterium]|nr:hypothetical protein [Bacteroidales bacterium]
MRNRFIVLFFFLSVSFIASAQKQVNSPYSRFNIGTMEPVGSFRSLGMGGISVGMTDNTSILFANPASYSSIDTLSFVFDFGFDYSKSSIKYGSQRSKSDDMNFDHLMIGFPVAKGFGIAAGVIPVSNGYYRITDEVESSDPAYNPIVGEYTANHTGNGSITDFFIGTGLRLHKYVSAGVNMNILFGQIKRENNFVFNDPDNSYYNDNSTEKLRLSGINFDYGLQFRVPVKEKYFVNAGVSATMAKKFDTDYSDFSFRYTTNGLIDTISYASGEERLKMPGVLRTGISFGRTNKLTAGFDFIKTRWSDANIPGSLGYYADTKTYMFGIEYTPERFSNFSFLKRIDYRIGSHFGDNYLVLNGEQLKEFGVTGGLGIFLKRGDLSKASFFIDYTRRYGSESNGLHTEHYITTGVSLNFYDVWFLKPKYY